MDIDMQNGHGHAAWTWTCSGWASWHCFKRFLETLFSLCHPSRVQAANDGHYGLLLHVYFKRYMTTAFITSRMMQKRRLHKIFRHLRRYLEALLHFFLRGQNTAATLYTIPQSTQSAGPVRFLIFCSISISLLASLVAGRRPQWTAEPVVIDKCCTCMLS